MRPQVQLLIGFALFVVANASAQGMIPNTTPGKWVVLVATSLTLYMQKIGLSTEPDRKPRSKEIADIVEKTITPGL